MRPSTGKAAPVRSINMQMTEAGVAKLKEELERRIKDDRNKIMEAVNEARSQGDLSENAEYQAAKDAQAQNESRISLLEERLDKVEIVKVGKSSSRIIEFGAHVTIASKKLGKEKPIVQIVGDMESDIEAGKISVSAPLAQALLGHSPGETVSVTVDGNVINYEILKVQYKG